MKPIRKGNPEDPPKIPLRFRGEKSMKVKVTLRVVHHRTLVLAGLDAVDYVTL